MGSGFRGAFCAAVAVAVACWLASTALAVTEGPAGPAFYQPPDPLPKGKHGDLIWTREIKAPKGADAWRILYRTELGAGEPGVSSGFLVAPEGKAPKGGRPVLAWAHGTEGAADNCAPSKIPTPARGLIDFFTYQSPFQQDSGVPGLKQFLNAGYAVVATDYAGLGTPGTQHYTVAQPELRNVLDSVIATQRFAPAAGGKNAVVLGWSQGGGAAIWANQGAGNYAPSVNVLGAAALAPAADTGPQFANQVAPGPVTPSSPFHGAAIELQVYVGFNAAYPELDPATVLTPAGLEAFNGALTQCVNHLAYVIENNYATPEDLKALFVAAPTPADWQQRLNENTPGFAAAKAPQLVMQGLQDTVINPNSTTNYVQRACAFGQPIQYTQYPTATHQTVPLQAKPEYIPWIADRFAGKPAPTNC